MCLCFRLCAHKQLVQRWQVEGSWRAEYPWLGPRPHRPPSSTDHRCPCLRISDWLWIQSCIGTSTNTHWMLTQRITLISLDICVIRELEVRFCQFPTEIINLALTAAAGQLYIMRFLLSLSLDPRFATSNIGKLRNLAPSNIWDWRNANTFVHQDGILSRGSIRRGVIVGVVKREELFFNKVWFPQCSSFLLVCNDLFIFNYSVRRFFRLTRLGSRIVKKNCLNYYQKFMSDA